MPWKKRCARTRVCVCVCVCIGSGLLTQVKGDVDRVGVLHPVEHGLALPPGGLLVRVEVCEQASAVAVLGVGGVTAVAEPRGARLHAVVLRWRAARVGHQHAAVEGGVFKLGHAAAGPPVVIVAGVHGPPDQEDGVAVEV